MLDITSLKNTHSESQSHKAMKHLLNDFLASTNGSIIDRSLEKYFGNRFADIFFKLKGGYEVVVEVQNSNISVNEIRQRTKDYNEKGAHVLWILHGEGKCTPSFKYPKDQKRVRISPAELFLHGMYGGRVYYANIDLKKNPSISAFFALHYSKPIKKNLRNKFKTQFYSFYIRDAHHVSLPNFNILCTTFLGYKIARFYDKNFKSMLKSSIKSYCQERNEVITKTIMKKIMRKFHKRFGKFLIFEVMLDLANEKRIIFDTKLLKKIKKIIL